MGMWIGWACGYMWIQRPTQGPARGIGGRRVGWRRGGGRGVGGRGREGQPISQTSSPPALQQLTVRCDFGRAGDVSTLEWVRGGLDDKDPATLTAVPVLIIAESGGAASDIWRYCSPESDTYLELPTVDARHDEEYVAACARLLPDIEELGKQTGTNSTKQMNFFVIDPDPEADNDNDLVLAIQTALLNDCPDINQEAMLAVAWGQAVILQRHLESDAANLLARPASPSEGDHPDTPNT